jgi:hypothetical protein
MSTRWYPIYQRGNPQLRIFLPNFWMKLVQLEKISAPSNKVLHLRFGGVFISVAWWGSGSGSVDPCL